MRKRPLSNEHAGLPMRKFKRPHSGTASYSTRPTSDFNLNVLICKPHFGNIHHWCIQLHNLATDDGTVFEVQGAQPAYEFTTYQCRPKYYALKVLQKLHVGIFTLSKSALDSIAHAIEHEVQVRNGKADWTCQDYVIDVLEMLEDEWWLDGNDDEYTEVKTKLEAMRGPIADVEHAVLTYTKSDKAKEEAECSSGQLESGVELKRRRVVQFAEDSDED